ncbi:unnamed protein product [Gemmata massiliana]|uniref:Uncharacterized protein n=1 Tax=Gemmata massiliana TaxID=1210884 RepID=A0A6P2CUE5_9BACT|nr:hypothetical protein [Gemmata massiliana]VTR92177.1 unnamed protein product [Gemmata massiliana]
MPPAKTWDSVQPVVYETLPMLAQRVGKTRMTVWNWIKNGITVGNRKVKLAAIRVGRQWCVAPDWYEQFLLDCNPELRALPESPAAEKRRLASEQARAKILIG